MRQASVNEKLIEKNEMIYIGGNFSHGRCDNIAMWTGETWSVIGHSIADGIADGIIADHFVDDKFCDHCLCYLQEDEIHGGKCPNCGAPVGVLESVFDL